MSWPTPEVNHLIDAMTRAEGGQDAMVRAVRCSMACADYAEARRIAANTIAHAAVDFVIGEHGFQTFVRFLGNRWAPVGATNDPTNLNANWVTNVLAALRDQGVTV